MADEVPVARTVPFDAPWNWLAAGWRDLWQSPQIGLAYGLAAAAGAGVLALGLMQVWRRHRCSWHWPAASC